MGQRTSPYSTTIVEAEGELGRLLPEWWALWSRTARATPFSSPAWLLPWWDAFRPGELFTAAVCRDGLLVGLAPFHTCARGGVARGRDPGLPHLSTHAMDNGCQRCETRFDGR